MTRLEGYIKINPKLGHGAPLQTKPEVEPPAGTPHNLTAAEIAEFMRRARGEAGRGWPEQTCSICEKPMRLCARAGEDREDKPNG